jgi:hypothetical protein
MRKIVSIFLLAIYMLCFSELQQFLKIPVLVQHYTEHKAGDPSISFFDFLFNHYTNILEQDADYQRDQQLPFRTTECLVYSVSICEFPIMEMMQHPAGVVIEKKYLLQNESNRSFLCTQDIFQPPRCA